MTKHENADTTNNDALEFAWQTHSYINEYIRFADAKALAVVAWTTAIMGGLFSVNAHRIVLESKKWTQNWSASHTALCCCISVAFFLLAVAFLCGVLVLVPRLNILPLPARGPAPAPVASVPAAPGPEPGVIFWKEILIHKSADELTERLGTATSLQRLKWVCSHEYVLAGVADRKFEWCNTAIQIGVWGSLFAFLAGAGLTAKG